jgi:hypothetical protein
MSTFSTEADIAWLTKCWEQRGTTLLNEDELGRPSVMKSPAINEACIAARDAAQ